jgi:hypothetical protein
VLFALYMVHAIHCRVSPLTEKVEIAATEKKKSAWVFGLDGGLSVHASVLVSDVALLLVAHSVGVDNLQQQRVRLPRTVRALR